MADEMDLRSSELQHKFIQDRINIVEDHFSDLHLKFALYTRKVANVRDSADVLHKAILNFASSESLNQTLRGSLIRLSSALHAVEDYRNTQVQRLDHKIVEQLTSYSAICRHAREELKSSHEARARELKKRSKLEKTRLKKPTNWQQINQATHEADLARNDATYATVQMGTKITDFERKKIEDIKKILLDFSSIEILFHTRALELYSKAYCIINEIDVDRDLEEFRNRFRTPFTQANTSEMNIPETPEQSSNAAETDTSIKTLDSHNGVVAKESDPSAPPPPKARKSLFTVKNVSITEPKKDIEVCSVSDYSDGDSRRDSFDGTHITVQPVAPQFQWKY